MLRKMKKGIITVTLLTAAFTFAEAQTAKFNYFTYTGNDARFDKQLDKSQQYLNPILAGFFPDPSLCRKGDTYYLVNSSFSFYPGVPIFTSKDLVNWKPLGHVLDRESQLPLEGQGVSGGIFAPAITYNAKNKTFYMITTNVGRGNFYVKTQDPAEGWSEPIYLKEVGGIDPSFFFDKNGKGYIVNNDEPVGGHDYEGQRSIMIHEFDVKGDSVIGEQKEILRGGTHVQEHPIWIEGPHLFRVGKYYYLMCAEGGTGDWHSEVILRAEDPMGPYEEFSGNPILTQRVGLDPDREDIVTSAGHADIVESPDGDWWAVFLGCRPYEGDCYNTGRDTYLLPVTWEDNWPTILESGKAIPALNEKAGLMPETLGEGDGFASGKYNTGNFTYTDKFTGSEPDMRWMYLRNPDLSLYKTGDGLEITPSDANISERKALSALFCRQQHNTFTAETELDYMPNSGSDFAGFVLLQNEEYNFTFGKTIVNGKTAIVLTRAEKASMTLSTAFLTDEEASKPIRLKIEGDGRYYDFYFATEGGDWQLVCKGADAINLSTHESGGFIGVCIGLYATKGNIM